MITTFGHQIVLAEWQFSQSIYITFLITVLTWALIAIVAYYLLFIVGKILARKIPGDIDDTVLAIIRWPFLLLVITFGAVDSLEILKLPTDIINSIEHLFGLFVILVVTYLVWKVFTEIGVYYARIIAERTESNVDDVLVPVVEQIGPVVIFIAGGAVVSQYLGVDLSALLVAIGGAAFIMAFALQDILSNVFSGISLIVDTPFKYGDLIVLEDGKICRIQKIGLRVTELYNIADHSIIFMPNSKLANERLLNITKPGTDLRVTIQVGVSYTSSPTRVKEILEGIAWAHPNILAAIPQKLQAMRAKSEQLTNKGAWSEIGTLAKEMKRLEQEHRLNNQLEFLTEELQSLGYETSYLEKGGLDDKEKARIGARLDGVKSQIEQIAKTITLWLMAIRYGMVKDKESPQSPRAIQARVDEYIQHCEAEVGKKIIPAGQISIGGADDVQAHEQRETIVRRKGIDGFDAGFSDIDTREEFEEIVNLWNKKLHSLTAHVTTLEKELQSGNEQRLDSHIHELRRWITTDFKETTPEWKYPVVDFSAFGDFTLNFELEVQIDDIVREHFGRRVRVETELREEILERFQEAGIEMPSPQREIFFKSALKVEHEAIRVAK